MTLEELRRYKPQIEALAAKYHCGNVRVFGSVARGEATPASDLDILIHPQSGCSLLDVVSIEEDISALLGGMPVEVVSDRALKKILRPYIIAEAVAL